MANDYTNAKGETMTTSLTAAEWNELTSLPADGKPYNVPGIAFRAVHYPATRIQMAAVIAETRIGTVRRRWSGKKWLPTEQVNGNAMQRNA